MLAVLLLMLGLWAGWAAQPAHGSQVVRAMVVFDNAMYGTPAADRALVAVGANVINQVSAARMAVVELPSAAAAHRLAARAGVRTVELDVPVRATEVATAKGKPSGGTTQPAQVLPWGINEVGASTVWGSGNRGAGVNVAVLDTGIDTSHPDLQANIAGGYLAIHDGKYRRKTSYSDDNGHGTHVAGIVAAVDNSIGVAGVAPGARLWSVKVLDSNGFGWTSDIVDALYWAIGTRSDAVRDNDIQIINMSLGADSGSTVEATALADASTAGILLAAAAGNDGSAVDYPAAYPEVVAVAALDSADAVPSWSSRGPQVELAAPGVSIFSTYKGGGYATLSGTSMASPHVAGAAALVWGAQPSLDAAGVRALLDGHAQDLGVSGRDELTGYGLVRPDWALGL